jgi:hypothetical protein
VVYQKQLPFQAMLMDTGLATHNLMLCASSRCRNCATVHTGAVAVTAWEKIGFIDGFQDLRYGRLQELVRNGRDACGLHFPLSLGMYLLSTHLARYRPALTISASSLRLASRFAPY